MMEITGQILVVVFMIALMCLIISGTTWLCMQIWEEIKDTWENL